MANLISTSSNASSEALTAHPRNFYEKNTDAFIYKNKSGDSMPYRLFTPQDHGPKKRFPLILSLHGAGSRGNDNLTHLRPWVAGWLDATVQKKNPSFILMPQCPIKNDAKWVNTPWEKGSYSMAKITISKCMILAKEILDKTLQEKPIDRNRIYVIGASMGGYGAWNIAMQYPDLFAAVVPICGGGDPSMAKTIKKIPIWAFHGDKDDVVPLSGSQDMIDAIKKVGGKKIKLTVYSDVKHDSYELAWKEQKLIEWVFKQNKINIDPLAHEN